MQRYLEQLIEDIDDIISVDRTPVLNNFSLADDEDDMDADFTEVNEFIYGERKQLSAITGIALEQLPDAKRLNTDQLALLAPKLELLLGYFNFIPVFPERLPDSEKYRAMRGIWNDQFVEMKIGDSHIEFCSYDEENCPFPGYCKLCEEWSSEYNKEDEDDKEWDADKGVSF